jgi:antitoxin component of RelBE/YafQ-DinJ toxin-antitoxin module
MIRFDAELLARADHVARRRGVSRSAWVAFTLSKVLDEEEQV